MFVSPAYTAVNVRVPECVIVIEQLPVPVADGFAIVQLSPLSALTVTLPVALPGDVTRTLTLTGFPAVDGLGVVPTMAVVVTAWLTGTVAVVVASVKFGASVDDGVNVTVSV